MVSLGDYIDQHSQPLPPEQNAGQAGASSYQSNGDSVFNRFADAASWADILEPFGWKQVKPADLATLEAWRHPDATNPISAHVLKKAPYAIINWSENSGLPVGKDQDLTKAKVYAILNYGGNESAAATAMLKGEATHLPSHLQEAVEGTRNGGARADLEGLISPERLANLINPDIPAWNHPPVDDPEP